MRRMGEVSLEVFIEALGITLTPLQVEIARARGLLPKSYKTRDLRSLSPGNRRERRAAVAKARCAERRRAEGKVRP